MQDFYTLPLSNLHTFLEAIIGGKTELIAPVRTNLIRFQTITDPADVCLEENAYFPLKGYFFRQNETLFEYDKNRIHPLKLKPKKRVFFGVRRCDLSAIARQDKVFLQGNHVDPYYAAQRAESILIGYHCATPPGKWCFCGSMSLEDFYDVMFWHREDDYLIHVRTEDGKKFFKPFVQRKLLSSRACRGTAFRFTPVDYTLTEKDRHTPDTNLLEKKDLAEYYNHPDWQKGCDQCVSCAACTTLCPTCFCSEPHEMPLLSKKGTGKRTRGWSSCQLQSFTRVAGNHIFRKKHLDRFKHRIFHQLQYFREQHGIDLCTGCGRCIAGCPTRIDFLSIINTMKQEKKTRIPLEKNNHLDAAS